MSSPINIDDLTEIFSVNPVTDFMITENEPEQFTTRATIAQVQSIQMKDLPLFQIPFAAGDVFFGQVTDPSTKFSTNFQDVTFPSATKIWLNDDVIPLGWKPANVTGDKLIAIKGGSSYLTGGTTAGTWTTSTVNGNNSPLTIEQIPGHTHGFIKANHIASDISNQPPRKGKIEEDDSEIKDRTGTSDMTGGNATHNHGNAWRPRASVGIIIEKI